MNLIIAGGLLALPLVSLEIGFRAGRRARAAADVQGSGQVGALQGAILGLLGLLLAFSFASAAGRFLEKQDLIVEEANAIGTAALRADLLPEPHRSALRESLRDYTNHRIAVSQHLHSGISQADLLQVEQLHIRIWTSALEGVRTQPGAMLGVLPPVNDTIDLHSTRVASGRKHLPKLVIGLLIVCSGLAMGVIGYGCGMSGNRRIPLTTSLALIIAATLWITYDLDHPRSGLMKLNDAPLRALEFRDT